MRRFRVDKPLVPAFYACDQLKIGFSSEANKAAGVERLFTVHAYIRLTCQHCRDAKQFLTGLAQRWKGIRVVYHDVERESGAMREMTELAQRYGIAAPSLPTIFVCGRIITGYRTDATTGRQIEELLWKASTASKPAPPGVRQPQQQRDTRAASLPVPTVWQAVRARVAIAGIAAAGYLFAIGGCRRLLCSSG
jgi:glutaredoxin